MVDNIDRWKNGQSTFNEIQQTHKQTTTKCIASKGVKIREQNKRNTHYTLICELPKAKNYTYSLENERIFPKPNKWFGHK